MKKEVDGGVVNRSGVIPDKEIITLCYQFVATSKVRTKFPENTGVPQIELFCGGGEPFV